MFGYILECYLNIFLWYVSIQYIESWIDMKNTNKDQTKDHIVMHLRLNKELANEIDEFTDSYNFTNRTDAVRFLISSGLKQFKNDKT